MRPLDDEPDFEAMKKQRGAGAASQANKGKVKRRLKGEAGYTRNKPRRKKRHYGR